jgi:hypothetical protein
VFCSSGRFRYVDIGNSPKGGSENAALALARSLFIRPDLFLLGDAAYRSDDRVKTAYGPNDLNPAIVGPGPAAAHLLFNQRMHAVRIRVEHAFSRVKHTWRLMESQWRMPLERLAPTFRACCLLANYLLRVRGLS